MLVGIPKHWRFAPLFMSLQTVNNHLARTSTGHLAKCSADCCDLYVPTSVTLSAGPGCPYSLGLGTYSLTQNDPNAPGKCNHYHASTPSGSCVYASSTYTLTATGLQGAGLITTVAVGANGSLNVSAAFEWSTGPSSLHRATWSATVAGPRPCGGTGATTMFLISSTGGLPFTPALQCAVS
jgi:hypothetical protein